MDPFWEGLGDGFRSFLEDFWWVLGFEKEMNFEAEVGSRKSDFSDVKGGLAGSRPEGMSALKTIVDQSIIDNIDRRSLTSLIVGY